ncbi:MAG: DUF1343 domain-containing protein [Tepidisphaeraceae bacterium]
MHWRLLLICVSMVAFLFVGPTPARGQVTLGIDRLAERKFDLLQGKRVAVITNHTGLTKDGTHLIDLLIKNKINVVKLFSPEHGLYGTKDEHVADGIDDHTGLPVVSLYGDKSKRKPSKEQLAGVDVMVFDIQDVGTRFYTYIATMGLCMEACAENNVEFVVLDRPNPIGGMRVDGPLNDAKHSGFTAYRRLPLVHGMTVGELAQLFNTEFRINAKLTVVPMTGWSRSMYWDDTGVKWVNPSPNMRSPTQAVLYPAIGTVESTNISVGRGTDTPFELLGVPYVNGDEFAKALTALKLPGIAFEPATWTPRNTPHPFNNQECHGVRIKLTDREVFQQALTGLSIAYTLHKLYPTDWQWQKARSLIQNDDVFDRLFELPDLSNVAKLYAEPLEQWKEVRSHYLIYQEARK